MNEKIYDDFNKPEEIRVDTEHYEKMCINLEIYEKVIELITDALEDCDYERIKDILNGLKEELI